MDREWQVEVATEAIDAAWARGSPVAQGAAEMARIAIRRWNSSARRKVDQDDVERRIEDLAKGLVQRFETPPELVGPLIEDYRYVARQIAARLLDESTEGD